MCGHAEVGERGGVAIGPRFEEDIEPGAEWAGSGHSPRSRRQFGRTAEADIQARTKAGTCPIDTRRGELPFAALQTEFEKTQVEPVAKLNF